MLTYYYNVIRCLISLRKGIRVMIMKKHNLFVLTIVTVLILSCSLVYAEPSAEAKSLFKRAMELNQRQDYATALNYLMKAYQISPEILAQDDQGLMDNATAFLKARVTSKPDNGEAHFQLAELLILRGMESEAAKHYEKVITLTPSSPLAILAQGELDKINQNQQQVAAITTTATQQTTEKKDSPKVAKLKKRVASLEDEVRSLQKKLKQQRADEKERFAQYEKMEEDYKQLQKDSALWKLSYIRHMSIPGASY
jgi:tetratricopeptide (TPR) repeat protein